MATFVLITPAKNEEKNIGKTIESVIQQTNKPAEWVIVSDGSCDRTDEIITSYCKNHSFIKYQRNESPVQKDFSSKVNAFNIGFKSLSISDFDFIGNLDADISFEPTYYENLIHHLSSQPKLGLVGGHIYEVYNGKVIPMHTSLNSVAGAVQLFRRECFQEIGGYIPIKMGGIDSAAEICARAKGWSVRTFPEYIVYHHGPVLTGTSSPLKTIYQKGHNKYRLGYHPIFHIVSSLLYLFKTPYILGAIYSIWGYCSSAVKKCDKVLPQEVIAYLRREQLRRLNPLMKKTAAYK